MSLPRDLLARAKLLATKEKSRPKQASLRRSVSAAYYALFHLLVDAAARRFVSGADRQPLRNCLARAFDHGVMKRVALQFAEQSLSPRLSPGLNGLAPPGAEWRAVGRRGQVGRIYRERCKVRCEDLERSFPGVAAKPEYMAIVWFWLTVGERRPAA